MITMLSARAEGRSEGVRWYFDLPIWPIATAMRCVWLVCAIASLAELGWPAGAVAQTFTEFPISTGQ